MKIEEFKNIEVSLAVNAKSPIESDNVTFGNVIELIRDNATLKSIVEELRTLSPEAYKKEKVNRIAAITPSAAFTSKQVSFTGRTLPEIIKYNHLLVIDFDNLSAQATTPDKLKERLAQEANIAFAFTSPSNDGVKAMVTLAGYDAACDDYINLTSFHEAARKQYGEYIETALNIKLDGKCEEKDVTRLCFLSPDSNPVLKDSEPFGVTYLMKQAELADLPLPESKTELEDSIKPLRKNATQDEVTANEKKARWLIEKRLKVIPSENYECWFRIGRALFNKFEGSEYGFTLFDQWSKKASNYDAEQVAYMWQQYKKTSNEKITESTIWHYFHIENDKFLNTIASNKDNEIYGTVFSHLDTANYCYKTSVGYKKCGEAKVDEIIRNCISDKGYEAKKRTVNKIRENIIRYKEIFDRLSFYDAGLQKFNGIYFLIHYGPQKIQPIKGEFPNIKRLLSSMPENDREHFVAWWARSVSAFNSQQNKLGQGIFIIGEKDAGKTVLTTCIKKSLGDVGNDVWKYASGESRFNGELIGACCWICDDSISPPAKSQLQATRETVAKILKQATVTNDTSFEVKCLTPNSFPIFRRLVFAFNKKEELLQCIPQVEDSISDKMNIYLMNYDFSNAPLDHEACYTELPHLIYYFLHEYKEPDTIKKNPRMGISAYRNPELAQSLYEVSLESNLLDLLSHIMRRRALKVSGHTSKDWLSLMDAEASEDYNLMIRNKYQRLALTPTRLGIAFQKAFDEGDKRIRKGTVLHGMNKWIFEHDITSLLANEKDTDL